MRNGLKGHVSQYTEQNELLELEKAYRENARYTALLSPKIRTLVPCQIQQKTTCWGHEKICGNVFLMLCNGTRPRGMDAREKKRQLSS